VLMKKAGMSAIWFVISAQLPSPRCIAPVVDKRGAKPDRYAMVLTKGCLRVMNARDFQILPS